MLLVIHSGGTGVCLWFVFPEEMSCERCFSGKMLDELHHVASKDLYSLMHQINAEYQSVNVLFIPGPALINQLSLIHI